jgi:hypothetical protein
LAQLEAAVEEGFQDLASLNIKLFLKLAPFAALKAHAGQGAKAVLLLESQSYAQLFRRLRVFLLVTKDEFSI